MSYAWMCDSLNQLPKPKCNSFANHTNSHEFIFDTYLLFQVLSPTWMSDESFHTQVMRHLTHINLWLVESLPRQHLRVLHPPPPFWSHVTHLESCHAHRANSTFRVRCTESCHILVHISRSHDSCRTYESVIVLMCICDACVYLWRVCVFVMSHVAHRNDVTHVDVCHTCGWVMSLVAHEKKSLLTSHESCCT